jgi:hypothetical protein
MSGRFVLGLHERQVGEALVDALDGPLARPLEADPLDERPGGGVAEDDVSPAVDVGALDRAHPDLGRQPLPGEERSQVVPDEVAQLGAAPEGRGELLVGVGLVLDVDLRDGDAVRAVSADELREVESVGVEDGLLHAHAAVVVGLRPLHPRGRAPGRGEELQVGTDRHRGLDVGDEDPLVTRDRKVLHRVVVLGLVQAVPLEGVVVGADRHPAEAETQAVLGVEDLVEHHPSLRLAQPGERLPAVLVEAAAEALDPLEPGREQLEIRLAGGLGRDSPLLPAGRLRGRDPVDRLGGRGSRAGRDGREQGENDGGAGHGASFRAPWRSPPELISEQIRGLTPSLRPSRTRMAAVERLTDTDPEVARVQMELLRRASPGRRLRLALSLSRSVLALSRGGIARRLPRATAEEVGLEFVRLHYGGGLAEEVRRHLRSGRP